MTSNTRSLSDLYHIFFHDMLLPKLQEERPMWDCRIQDRLRWVILHRFYLDLWIGVGFTREDKLRIDLHIGGSILNRYPHLYHELCKKESLIKEALGLPLIFTAPGSGSAVAGRIEVDRPATIKKAHESNVILDWTVLNVISFRSAFTSHIKELLS